jgi:WXG100 family type VII secretion target
MIPGLQFQRAIVQELMGTIKKQHSTANDIMSQVKGYGPMVQGAWIGPDANEFVADIARKFVPAMTELMLAIAGINVNLTKATETVDQADSKAKSIVSNLADTFSKIY